VALLFLVRPARGLVDDYLVLGPGSCGDRSGRLSPRYSWTGIAGVLNLLGLWFVGAAVERTLGRRRFSSSSSRQLGGQSRGRAAVGLVGPVALYSGCGDSVLGLFVGLAVLYGPAQVRVIGTLAMPARALAAISLVWRSSAQPPTAPGLSCSEPWQRYAWPTISAGGRGRDVRELISWLQRRTGRRSWRVMDGGKSSRRPDRFN